MLTGKGLLEFVQQSEGTNDRVVAEKAGYVRMTKTGKRQIMLRRFYNEILRAQGMTPVGRSPGQQVKNRTTVHRSGVILLGKVYSYRFGLRPGDELDIVIEDDYIKLVPRSV